MAATVQEVRAQVDQLSATERQELANFLPPPVNEQLGRVWYLLITVLFIGAVLSGYAAYNLYTGNNAESGAIFLAITTTIVGGLIGLLAPSPAQK